MIESIEGKRGRRGCARPTWRRSGLFGRPTLEHNFHETLYWVRDIVERGAAGSPSTGRGRSGPASVLGVRVA